jgi:hypothetical protein
MKIIYYTSDVDRTQGNVFNRIVETLKNAINKLKHMGTLQDQPMVLSISFELVSTTLSKMSLKCVAHVVLQM